MGCLTKGGATGRFAPQRPDNRLFDLGCGYRCFEVYKEVIRLACSLCHGSLVPSSFDWGIKAESKKLWALCHSIPWKPFLTLSSVSCLFLSLIHSPILRNVWTSWAGPDTQLVQI